MITSILKALKELNAESYFVTEKKRSSAQLFFVKKELDQTRSVQVTDYSVSLFRDLEKDGKHLTGSATCNLEEGIGEEEIRESLKKAWNACQYSANPGFSFLPGVKETAPAPENRLAKTPLLEAAWEFAKAIYACDVQGDPLVNSAEVFVTRTDCRIVGGNGCDVSYTTYSADGEYVAQCKKKADVEMHHIFAYDDLNTQELSQEVEEALKTVVSRSVAEKTTPRGSFPVVLSDRSVQTILRYYAQRASAPLIYPGYSDFKKGMDVMGETAGDRVTMKLMAKEPFSEEGIPMKDRILLDNGVLQAIQGETRLCSYLGEEPTGSYRAFQAECGSMSFEEMTQGRVLHLVSFSDFQMDPFSGYFGGEIRLGYLYENGRVTPVTGGSVSGNFIELQKNMRLSREQQKSGSFTGPKHILFQNVPVNGQEE